MLIIVLGGGIDLNGNLPPHVYQRLDKAIDVYQRYTLHVPRYKKNLFLVVSGKYSFLYDQLKKYPPTTEAEAMAGYLKEKHIAADQILLEKDSQDTISNAYYLKKNIFIPHQEKEAVIITSKFHLPRVKYIFKKIFGPSYKLEFIGVQENLPTDEEKKVVDRQKKLLAQTKKILKSMTDGNHSFLDGKFYKIDYYRQKRPAWVTKFVTEGAHHLT